MNLSPAPESLNHLQSWQDQTLSCILEVTLRALHHKICVYSVLLVISNRGWGIPEMLYRFLYCLTTFFDELCSQKPNASMVLTKKPIKGNKIWPCESLDNVIRSN